MSLKPNRKTIPVPLTSENIKVAGNSVTGKEKATISIGKKQEKTPMKVNRADSSSTIKTKENSHGKVNKIPTPGTCHSPRIRVNLAASVFETPTE
jgi:hypothetical protein